MKSILTIIALAICTSCTMPYDLNNELILNDYQLMVCKELYGDKINYDKIYSVPLGDKVDGYYLPGDDTIQVDSSIDNQEYLLCVIIHELYHRYDYKVHGASVQFVIDAPEIEWTAQVIMQYGNYRLEVLGIESYVEYGNTWWLPKYAENQKMFALKMLKTDGYWEFTLGQFKEYLIEHTEFKY